MVSGWKHHRWRHATNIHPIEDGVYTVQTSSGYGCVQMSEPFDLTGLGIESLFNSSFSVYPTLVRDFIMINNQTNSKTESVTIYDETGRVMMNKIVTGN